MATQYYDINLKMHLWLTIVCILGLVGLAASQELEMMPSIKCREFSTVNEEQREFYSPQYPGNYSGHLDCILNITAEFGYQIRLDFRDYFQIEPSENCINDFLEIRDGPHGYSDKLGRYCGSEFPPIITSKDRHLWLRFNSDESLEYKGFRAVYEFIKNPGIQRPEIEACMIHKEGVQGTVLDTDITATWLNYSLQYSLPLDCTWRIEVEPGHKIYLFFDYFKLNKPNECDQNYVDLFEGKRDMTSRMKHYCGSAADAVTTKGTNLLFFRYYAIKANLKSEFKAYFTAQRDIMQDNQNDDVCTSDEYDCEDATCIDKSLQCNGVKNCRHQYDEEGCHDSTKAEFDISSQHIVIILVIGCALLAGMCFAMCYNCIKKLVIDSKKIRENINRSRDQLNRSTLSMSSMPKVPRDGSDDEDLYIDSKTNGHTCVHVDEELTEEEEEEEQEDMEDEAIEDDLDDSCIEMRDCECQTRGTMTVDTEAGQNGTPSPPPPPLRRPPDVPHFSPLGVPTPPPPPASHYSRHGRPLDPFGGSFSPLTQHIKPYANEPPADLYKQINKPKNGIKGRDRSNQAPKPTPDVLVTH